MIPLCILIYSCVSQQDFDISVSLPNPSQENTQEEVEESGYSESPPESLGDLLRILNANGTLTPTEMVQAESFMEQKIRSPVYCDEVWRVLLSPTGAIIEEPNMVWSHASVPDILILESGAHLLVFNDLRPDIFMDTLRNNPSRFWKQGLIGYGGVGFAIDNFDGNGFVEHTDVHLHFQELQRAVDPDLGKTKDGTIRLSWFGMTTDVLGDGFISPMQTEKPHRFYRSVREGNWDFSIPQIAVSSFEGTTGGVDPTILSLQEGGEILFVAPLDFYAVGWFSQDGENWPENADVFTEISGATADALLGKDGLHHMYYMKNGFLGVFEAMSSTNGFDWDIGPSTLYVEEGAHNLSVDIDPQGNIWLYYNQLNPECMSALDAEND